MSRIGSGGAPPKGPSVGEEPANLRTQEGVQKFKETAGKDVPTQVVDSFSRASAALESKLQALGGKAQLGKLNFTNAELAVLAQAFAQVIKQNPGADRLKRAKLFAQTVLKKRKLGKILDSAAEKELEEMFDIIADQLDSSPRFAQLVDEVTESARKIGS